MSRGDPKRTRTSVVDGGRHVGYATVVEYPDRDLSAFPEGMPYYELAVSDLAERHVALLQRFKQHWLIHCGSDYDTADASGALTAKQVGRLAALALRLAADTAEVRLAALKREVEKMLGG
jgi:hypothetical protein